jgi:hypothetical protein
MTWGRPKTLRLAWVVVIIRYLLEHITSPEYQSSLHLLQRA